MNAKELRILEFLETRKTQFIIPIYQRNYDWTESQCKQLLQDISEVANNKDDVHFIGSIVYMRENVYGTTSEIKEFLIIDGQQRLTTLTLIYLTIYRLFAENHYEERKDEILNTYLVNSYVKSEHERLKLRSTDINNEAINFLLEGRYLTDKFKQESRIIKNFEFFRARINLENVDTILTGLSKLIFVEISLEKGKDNPQRIFESLNSTGLALSQSDLIRNYIFMGLDVKKQKSAYKSFWSEIENLTVDEKKQRRTAEFFRDYLTSMSNKAPNKDLVYTVFKKKYSYAEAKEVIDHLAEIKRKAGYWNKLLNPANESNPRIRKQFEYFAKLDITIARPFLIKVYEDYDEGLIDENTFIEVLELLQSYIWRRFISDIPNSDLNKVFMKLYNKINRDDYLTSLQKALLRFNGKQRFPTDEEVIAKLKLKDVYNIKTHNSRYLLDRLEESFNSKEAVDLSSPISIEHIFPQKPSKEWLALLDDEQLKEMTSLVNTLANLTLTGYNPELSNRTFPEKLNHKPGGFKDSQLQLNKYLAQLEKWDLEELNKRFEALSKRFLSIWSRPNISLEPIEEEVNIFDIDYLEDINIKSATFFGKDIPFKQLAKIYTEVFRHLFKQDPDKIFTINEDGIITPTELGDKLKFTWDKGSLFKATQINEDKDSPVKVKYYIESDPKNVDRLELIKYALEVFDAEDALIFKLQG